PGTAPAPPTPTPPAPASAPAATAPPPAPAPSAPQPSMAHAAGAALGGLWSGLRGWLQPKNQGQPAPAPAPKTTKDEDSLEMEQAAPAAAPPSAAPEHAFAAAGNRLEVGAATSTGRVRTRNEDSYLTQHLTLSNLDQRRELALLVVADGM